MDFFTYTYTDIGSRQVNEDCASYRSDKNGGIWVLADGLGGHADGEVASSTVVNSIIDSYKNGEAVDLFSSIEEANTLVREKQDGDIRNSRMSSTAVAACIYNEFFDCAYVGDSRLYYFRDGKILFRTKDHSVAQMAVDLGEIDKKSIRTNDDRNKLIRVIGMENEARPERPKKPFKVKSGDAFMLCSDGFWEYVYGTEAEIDLAKSAAPIDWTEFMLCRAEKRRSAQCDNLTVMTCMIK